MRLFKIDLKFNTSITVTHLTPSYCTVELDPLAHPFYIIIVLYGIRIKENKTVKIYIHATREHATSLIYYHNNNIYWKCFGLCILYREDLQVWHTTPVHLALCTTECYRYKRPCRVDRNTRPAGCRTRIHMCAWACGCAGVCARVCRTI